MASKDSNKKDNNYLKTIKDSFVNIQDIKKNPPPKNGNWFACQLRKMLQLNKRN